MLVGDVIFFLFVIAEVVKCKSWSGGVCEFVANDSIAFTLGIVALKLPFAGTETVVPAFAVVLLDKMFASLGIFFAEQCVHDVETVGAGIIRQLDPCECGKTGGEIDGADHLTGNAL